MQCGHVQTRLVVPSGVNSGETCAGCPRLSMLPAKTGGNQDMPTMLRAIPFALFAAALATAPMDYASAQPSCPAMRKINIGVSVAPPNVVHTSPYVAKALGLFGKRCIDAAIIQFEGGQSQTANVAAAQGSAIVSVSDVAIGRGLKVQPISRASGGARPAAGSAASTGAWAARC